MPMIHTHIFAYPFIDSLSYPLCTLTTIQSNDLVSLSANHLPLLFHYCIEPILWHRAFLQGLNYAQRPTFSHKTSFYFKRFYGMTDCHSLGDNELKSPFINPTHLVPNVLFDLAPSLQLLSSQFLHCCLYSASQFIPLPLSTFLCIVKSQHMRIIVPIESKWQLGFEFTTAPEEPRPV